MSDNCVTCRTPIAIHSGEMLEACIEAYEVKRTLKYLARLSETYRL